MAHVVYVNKIEEQVVAGKRLGRHVHRDSRSLMFLAPITDVQVTSKLWPRHIPILDQGDLGSCTGNAMTGALGTTPFFETMSSGFQLNEAEAVRLYSEATQLDPYPGQYPPDDTGSDGLSVSKAAQQDKLINGYTHAVSLQAFLQGMMASPMIIGINWYDSFDHPASNGTVSISAGAQVRGGHEIVVRGVDVANRMLRIDNSWGSGWGDQGSFQFTFDTFARLLSEDGDATLPVPLSAPPPQPQPPAQADAYDHALAESALNTWAAQRHTGQAASAAAAYEVWRHAKGL